jgi:hypothetical protein
MAVIHYILSALCMRLGADPAWRESTCKLPVRVPAPFVVSSVNLKHRH